MSTSANNAVRALAAAAALLLGGCRVGPAYVTPPVAAPAGYKEMAPADGAVWQPAQPGDAALRGDWWQVFHDPTLDGLEGKAAGANQQIAAAAANVQAARALVREARALYFPTVTVDPGVVDTRPSPAELAGLTGNSANAATLHAYGEYSLPAAAVWEPDLFGRVRAGVAANQANAQAGAADAQSIRLLVQSELAADYFQLRGQDAMQSLLDSTVAAYRQSLELNRELYNAGLANEESVAQAETQWQQARAQASSLGVLRAQLEHAIAVLIGEPPADLSLPPGELAATPPPLPVGIPSQLLQRRPDIAAAERAVAMANAQIGVAQSAYFPAIVLSAGGGFANSSLGAWLSWPSRFWSVGPSLAETVFDGGLRKATLEQTRAAYDAAVANYRQAALGAFADVEDNLAALRILSVQLQQQDAAVAAAARTLAEATARYNAGLDPYLNVLTAQSALLSDRQASIAIRAQQLVGAVQLIKALGGGWDVSQLTVNAH